MPRETIGDVSEDGEHWTVDATVDRVRPRRYELNVEIFWDLHGSAPGGERTESIHRTYRAESPEVLARVGCAETREGETGRVPVSEVHEAIRRACAQAEDHEAERQERGGAIQ